MKTLMTAIALTLSFASFAEAKTLSCQSFAAVDGWTGTATHDFAILTANLGIHEQLSSARISGAFLASAEVSLADTAYTSKNPRYQDYTRFSALEDAWCWYSPFLPKQITNLVVGTQFTGFVNRTCENGASENIAMKCVIK